MKNLILSLTLSFSAAANAQVDIVKVPDLSMIKTATLMEVMQILSTPGNKIYWTCNEDIRQMIQRKQTKLSALCRSELNRLLTKDVKSNGPDITNLAEEITKNADSDLERVSAIYTWVTKNISYDVDTYAQIVKNKKILPNPLELIAASKTLERRKAIAEGYSLLTAALIRAVNIPAVTVVGYALKGKEVQGAHAWNEAYVDDRWINLDTTWDAGGITGNMDEGLSFVSRPARDFFDMPDSEFKKTHKAVFDIK